MRLSSQIYCRDADLDVRHLTQLEEEPEDRACSAIYLFDHFPALEVDIRGSAA